MSDNWEVYFTNVDDAPASVLVDLGIAESIPDPERPMLLWMGLQLKNPTDEGFACEEEEEQLVKIEDSFIDAVELTSGAILVGRITSAGRREFYFYAKSSEGFEDTIAEAMENFDDYEYETGEQEDSEWLQYLSILYPAPENMQEIFNQRVIEQLTESGDSLTAERLVDHFASFANEADRETFTKAAQKIGFSRHSESRDDSEEAREFPFSVTLQRSHAVDWDTVDEMTFSLFELAQEHNGSYEGWGSPVVAK